MAAEYHILQLPAGSTSEGFQPYGAVAQLWQCKDHEVILAGPAETGKTRGAIELLDFLLWKHRGSQASMIRKQYSDMPGSCIQTYEKKVLGAWNPQFNDGQGGFDQSLTPVKKYGGEKPQFYSYPNGSRLWIGGLDKPGKVLSSERDFAYINQAEELELADWETIVTRVTGRAGNAPYSQVFADCNPGPRNHWILERERDGGLTLLHSRHEDNPTLYDPLTKELTAQGKITMGVLDSLTGVRYSRLRKGLWVSVEGLIYGEYYDPAFHLIEPFEIPGEWTKYRVVDFGLSHPFVCNWFATDNDGRLYLYRQIYMTGRTVATHAIKIKELSQGEIIKDTICDHDAEDRLTLKENGIPNIAAKKDVLSGINKVQERLKRQIDGKPRLFIFKNSLVEEDQTLKMDHKPYSTEQELDSYIWANTSKEQPVKEYDHGLDTVRYMVVHLDGVGQWRNIPFLHI